MPLTRFFHSDDNFCTQQLALIGKRNPPQTCFQVAVETTRTLSYSDEGGSLGLESGLVSLCGCTLTLVGLGELGRQFSEGLGVLASESSNGHDAGTDDLDSLSTSGMAAGHLGVHLGHSAAKGDVTVLFVHVDSEGTGQVAQNNTVVLDAVSVLFVDFRSRNDFTLDLADLVLALHVVPELGASKHGITSKDADSVKLGLRSRL